VRTVTELGEAVRRAIQAQWPDRFTEAELTGDVPLGEAGLGLDSIEIAEVILACEDDLGLEVDERLFRDGPLTLRGLAGKLAGA
jgi:acyl carrier protein